MKKLLFFLVTFLTIACSTTKDITYGSHLESIKTEQVQTSTMTASTTKFNGVDFSNYCYDKNLPRDIKKWSLTRMRNGETGELVSKYLYMTSQKDVFIMSLNINGTDTTFVVTNRTQH